MASDVKLAPVDRAAWMLQDECALVVFTIGHSTLPIAEFIRRLKAHGVQRVIDVRTIPRSRHNPQFNRAELSPALHRSRIHYRYLPGLGGLRHARRDSTNTAWRNASFRGYADYMQTPAFEESLEQCLALAAHERVVLMCAEAVPWRCHRSLIADALLVRGVAVFDIATAVRTRRHTLTPWAHVQGTTVTYPAILPSASPAVASKDEPQYEIASNTTDHVAMHQASALRKLS
ncbi:MAG: DUF488 family protein [Acidobacteriota bacterium]